MTIIYEVVHIDHLGEDYTDIGDFYDEDHEEVRTKILTILADPDNMERNGEFEHENTEQPFTAKIRWEFKS